MNWRIGIWVGSGLVVLCLFGFGGWMLSLPPSPAPAVAPAVAPEEHAAALSALRPRKRSRPLVAVLGINDATETTDYLVTYGILRRADVADVMALATGPGPVRLYPALTVEPDATTAAFDAAHLGGADYVIVPAMSRDDDPAALQWLRSQAAKGAFVIGVCAGAKVVGEAGLLEGRRATTHWYYREALRAISPGMSYVPDRRFVIDGSVATTTGITASMPMMLTLIEAIAGRARAAAVAVDLGLTEWDARHASAAFRLTRPFAATVLRNRLAFWRHEELGIDLRAGMDEVALALAADAWSRTYRSRAVTFADGPVETRSGIRILPDRPAASRAGEPSILAIDDRRPVEALDATLAAIAERYGASTARVVAMQLEYPGAWNGPDSSGGAATASAVSAVPRAGSRHRPGRSP
ncbi:DJ-1/PfpI family protein [Aurantimonas sp. HBX-1]|uniref:DJ-1/PfpI family protein n=1 Tax=Aurantimonas sp. HBX-1 TaxID=2906072 RepID=UPI001F3B8C20|nr:DJ-1/PfpI family protein [Aurantimonas sp. HBX-1]UIJ72563.1 DJ-1/PfpI family protein [Aurantimonas sp. HBX-1]